MKILTALTTALMVMGFATAASAMCNGMKAEKEETAELPPILYPPKAGT